VVETGGLENRFTRKGNGGSNPSPSASKVPDRAHSPRWKESKQVPGYLFGNKPCLLSEDFFAHLRGLLFTGLDINREDLVPNTPQNPRSCPVSPGPAHDRFIANGAQNHPSSATLGFHGRHPGPLRDCGIFYRDTKLAGSLPIVISEIAGCRTRLCACPRQILTGPQCAQGRRLVDPWAPTCRAAQTGEPCKEEHQQQGTSH
jgi:hypothetical protein